jgi:MFS transporter, FHS family, glucose/mannose:H+ symporter
MIGILYVASSFRDGSTRLHLGSFIALGCSVLLLGPSLETFRTGAGVSLGQIGILISAGSIGYLLGSVSCGRLLEHFHAHRMLGGGLLLVAIALVALTTVHSLTALIVWQTVVGFGGAMVDVTGNTVVLWTHKGGAVVNALHLAFGVGAILGPIIVSRSLAWSGSLRGGYLLVAGTLAILAVIVLRRPSPPNPHAVEDRGFPKGKGRLLLLALLWFVSYAWVELGFQSWIFEYGAARGLDRLTRAALLGTAFLVAFSLGRLLAIPLASRVSARQMMAGDVALCVAGLLVMLLGGRHAAAMWGGTILFGFGTASMFPSMLSMAEPVIPSTSSVTSTFLVGSSIGSIFLPRLIGELIQREGPIAMPAMVLAGVVVNGGIVLAFDRSARRS